MLRRLLLPAVLGALAVHPVTAQSPRPAAASSSTVELKSPELAKRYAYYFTGGGYFYTGETPRAAITLGISAISLWKFADEIACSGASNTLQVDMGCSRGKAFLWLAGVIAPYVYGIKDAEKSAERVNAKLHAPKTALLPLVETDQSGKLRAGLMLSLTR